MSVTAIRKATAVDDPKEDARVGRIGKQTIEDTGPLLIGSILRAGNSNGDIEMLTFAGGKDGPALRLLIVHDPGRSGGWGEIRTHGRR